MLSSFSLNHACERSSRADARFAGSVVSILRMNLRTSREVCCQHSWWNDQRPSLIFAKSASCFTSWNGG